MKNRMNRIRTNYGSVLIWLTVHKNPDHGFTWNSSQNLLHQELWPLGFENRLMRLDRLLLKSSNLAPTSIELFANQPVYASESQSTTASPPRGRGWWATSVQAMKGLAQLPMDYFDVSILRDPRVYLYPSDHFGLVATLTLSHSIKMVNKYIKLLCYF